MTKSMNPKYKIIVKEDIEELTNELLKKWLKVGQEAIRQKGLFTCALSGGNSPRPFYRKLSEFKDIDCWSRTHIFLVDERFVPRKHPQSNAGLLYEHLLKAVALPRANIHMMITERISAEQSALQYASEIVAFFHLAEGEFPCFDFVLLGIGEDGHTGSLFPGSPQLMEKERLVVTVDHPALDDKRISLTLPVLNGASCVAFLVYGKGKAAPLKSIMEEGSVLPAAQVHPFKGELIFFMDRALAAELPLKSMKNVSTKGGSYV